jgi:hypothetical protein
MEKTERPRALSDDVSAARSGIKPGHDAVVAFEMRAYGSEGRRAFARLSSVQALGGREREHIGELRRRFAKA